MWCLNDQILEGSKGQLPFFYIVERVNEVCSAIMRKNTPIANGVRNEEQTFELRQNSESKHAHLGDEVKTCQRKK